MAEIGIIVHKTWERVKNFFAQLEPVQFVVQPQTDSKIKPNIICYFEPKSVVAEEYRTVRTNLQFALSEMRYKTFLITSSVNQEGKSVTTINLATVFAQNSKSSVLIVDCDLRKPTMHKYLGLEMSGGLVDYCTGAADFDSVVKTTEIPNLCAVTCGAIPQNPSEILASVAMDRFISQAQERYEYVVFDSPPIIPVTDAAVLGPRLAGAVLLIKSDDTQQETATHAYRSLKQAKTNILGIMLTNTRQYIPRYLYRYQYYHYYHYYHYK